MLDSAAYTTIGQLNPFLNKGTTFSFIYHCPLNSNLFTKFIQNDSNPLSMLRIQDVVNQSGFARTQIASDDGDPNHCVVTSRKL
uniref:Uncharacterized protein MANES_01G028800 n=1 Tax=Rhizophora mucronata TaxID=61149 RepID=A0A2P2LEC8_RHIMU